jgi:O-antigen/teichoic acid export membrane protein
MNLIQTLFKNMGWLVFSQLIVNILALLYTLSIANYINVDNFGIMNGAISFMTITSIFMDVGMSIYVTRDISRNKNLTNKYLGNMIPLKIVLSLIVLSLTFMTLLLLKYPILNLKVFLIFGLQFALTSMVSLFNGIFQAYEKSEYQAINNIINSIMLLLLIFATIYLNMGLIGISIAYMLSALIALIYSILVLNNIIKVKLEFDFKFWYDTVKNSFPFGLTNFFSTIYFLVDTLMLIAINGDFAGGIYSAAYKIIFVFTTIYTTYTIVIFPVMSKFYQNSNNLLKLTYAKSIKHILMITLPICIYVSFYSKDIISILYTTKEYALSATVLQILVWNLPFLFLNGLSTQFLNSSSNETTITKINLIACVFNVIINFILIEKFTYIGASISVLLTSLLIFILINHTISKEILKIDTHSLKSITKILIASAILITTIYIFNVSLIMAIPLSILIYSTSIILLKVLNKGDIYILKEIINKNP